MVAVIFGSSTLNTEFVAQRVARVFGEAVADLHNVKTVTPDILSERRSLVFVTSTWGAGDLQDDWEAFLPQLEQMDFHGKTVGLVGVGDQENYPDTFCDSIALLYEIVIARGATVVGATSTDGYTFNHSRSARDETFVGLVLDEDNQADRSDQRIRAWVRDVRPGLVGTGVAT